MNIENALNQGVKILKENNIPNPYLDCEILLSESINKDKTLKWILHGIKLKIVNKKYKDGKYYLTEGTVGDIITPEIFSFIAEKGEALEDLREKDVETVIPKLQNKIIILSGKFKGSVGILLERSKSKNEVVVK